MNKSDWKPFCELMNATAEEIGAKPKGASGLSLTFKNVDEQGTVLDQQYRDTSPDRRSICG